MKQTLLQKIFGGYIILIVLLSLLILLTTLESIRRFYQKGEIEDLEHLGLVLSSHMMPVMEEGRYEEMNAEVRKLGKSIKTRITVIRPDGTVIADSEEEPRNMENHRGRPEITQASGGKIGVFSRYSSTLKTEMLYVAVPIRSGGDIIGVVRVSLAQEHIGELISRLKFTILEISGIILILALVGAYVFSRSLTRPIRALTEASHRVGSGNFDSTILLESNDELGQLADSFNLMVSRIQKLVKELSEDKEALNTIIGSIHEGLMVLDTKGKILLCNKSLQEMTGGECPEDKFYWEIIREPRLGDIIRSIGPQRLDTSGRIDLGGKHLLCHGTYLPQSRETVLTLHDITQIVNIEKLKRDFVVNVSHELRTPLTAIKGFVETMEESIDETNRQYLEIIKRHTERIINIVNDLLLLSELEEPGMKIAVKDVNLAHLVENIIRMFEPRLKEKGLNLELTADAELPILKADGFKLEQMFINLISNAINFTEEGKVSVNLTRQKEGVKIEIVDTGIGIPRDFLPRIFERFFVVDKSHSRRVGGTGLGLSIVKHIVLLHNGAINVESMPGMGTKFTILLPSKY